MSIFTVLPARTVDRLAACDPYLSSLAVFIVTAKAGVEVRSRSQSFASCDR
ncbi:MAG: hypothetical protein HC849_31295 [Oscillatoriales cyanobacterium RU_3_3]|nr:hypothetical protein [Microcoleus sp. SU_5_6]NJL66986.1 hypothetical protein [Microcoleus sp. SM1_3_4]NJM63632.1 hypothetical protein [Oscillatoriales cyanobacterium RU_3_3]NJR21614.1 hypothetical protein [Richelia sp. CSU_2_1]